MMVGEVSHRVRWCESHHQEYLWYHYVDLSCSLGLCWNELLTVRIRWRAQDVIVINGCPSRTSFNNLNASREAENSCDNVWQSHRTSFWRRTLMNEMKSLLTIRLFLMRIKRWSPASAMADRAITSTWGRHLGEIYFRVHWHDSPQILCRRRGFLRNLRWSCARAWQ